MKNTALAWVLLAGSLISCHKDSAEQNQILQKDASITITEMVTIDFEEFAAGDLVTTVSPSGCDGTVEIYALNPAFPDDNAAMAFDSSNPTGDDFDLGTPNDAYGGPGVSENGDQESNQTAQGMVLIISEDLDQSNPDDSYIEGSYYELDFSNYGYGTVTMYSFLMIDLDGNSKGDGTFVKLYDKDGGMLLEKEIIPGNDNAVQTVDLEGTSGVAKMVLELNNSGAIDDIKFSCDRELEVACETMFARGGNNMCFLDDDNENFSRWGWTNLIEEGFEGSLEIWAAAGQCETEKGTKVGYLHVSYIDGSLTAEYEMTEGFYMEETHFYVGSAMYPNDKNGKPTVAPGQYPYQHDLDYTGMDSYSADGLEGAVYLIAHGVVCADKSMFSDDDDHEEDDD